MNTTTLYLHQELRRTEQIAHLAIERIRRAQSLGDVVQAMTVHVRAELRSVKHLCPSLRRLKREAEKSARTIVDRQLSALASVKTTKEFLTVRGTLMCDWRVLNGRLPVVAHYVRAESTRLWSECFKRELAKPSVEAMSPAQIKEL